MRHLQVMCPQLYEGTEMKTTPCTRCTSGWSKTLGRCTVETGAEHLPDVAIGHECPIANVCQHQIQEGPGGLCAVRRKGLICESALVAGGLTLEEAWAHPLGFNAMMVA